MGKYGGTLIWRIGKCSAYDNGQSSDIFSGQLKHLTGQAKFGQSNILYIINGKVIKFLIEKPMSGQFSILISTVNVSVLVDFNLADAADEPMLHA